MANAANISDSKLVKHAGRSQGRPLGKTGRRNRSRAAGTESPPPLPDESTREPEGLQALGARMEPKPSAKNQNAAAPDANFLSMYFREMSELDVLQPQQEFHCARRIEELEIGVWERLFELPTSVDWVARQVEGSELNGEAPSFRAVRAAATRARKSPTKKNRAALARAARKVAEKVHPVDKDRLVMESLLETMRGLERGAGPDVPFSVRTRAFRDNQAKIAAADAAAARARNDFVRANLRLVVSIARRFNHGRMSLADLIQEGNIGLMKAVERYDYRRGFRFSTYASWWIRHAISRALADKGRQVRLPVHMIDAYHRLARSRRELTTKLGRNPSNEELAAATKMSASKIEKMRTYLADQQISLDRPVNDEDGRHLIEVLEDPKSVDEDIADQLATQAMSREVRELLAGLKPIEADILRRRFGLDDDNELTLKEIGQKYNLSRERIRQLQEQALGKMRRALEQRSLV